MDTRLWVAQWPILMHNAIEACAVQGAKLVFFDNTYMYPQTAQPQTEDTAFLPYGAKKRFPAFSLTRFRQGLVVIRDDKSGI